VVGDDVGDAQQVMLCSTQRQTMATPYERCCRRPHWGRSTCGNWHHIRYGGPPPVTLPARINQWFQTTFITESAHAWPTPC